MAEEINKTYTSNSLYNDSTGVIAFAEQLKQELINWANYQHVTEELGQNRPDLQNELNNLFLSVYERFLTFLNDADASEEAINTWKEIENFLADYTDEKTLASIVAELNNKIESRLTVPLESTTGSSTTSTMTQKAITETVDASKTFTTGEKVDNVGIDDVPTIGSENLVKSGGCVSKIILNYITNNSSAITNPQDGEYFYDSGNGLLYLRLSGAWLLRKPKSNVIYLYKDKEYVWTGSRLILNPDKKYKLEGIYSGVASAISAGLSLGDLFLDSGSGNVIKTIADGSTGFSSDSSYLSVFLLDNIDFSYDVEFSAYAFKVDKVVYLYNIITSTSFPQSGAYYFLTLNNTFYYKLKDGSSYKKVRVAENALIVLRNLFYIWQSGSLVQLDNYRLDELLFEQGGIDTVGNNGDNPARIRTKNYITGKLVVFVPSGFILRAYYYNASTGVYDSSVESTLSFFEIYKQNCKARLVVQKSDGTNLIVEDVKRSLALENLNERLSIFEDSTKLEFDLTPSFKGNKYIADNVTVGSSVTIEYSDSDTTNALILSCKEGDKFVITGTGVNARLWSFANSSGVILSNSVAQASATNLNLIAPENSAFALFNVRKDLTYSLKKLTSTSIRDNFNNINLNSIAIENGAIDGATGRNLPHKKYVRTANYLTGNCYVKAPEGFKIKGLFYYDKVSGTYLGGDLTSRDEIYIDPRYGEMVRIRFAKSNSTECTVEDFKAVTSLDYSAKYATHFRPVVKFDVNHEIFDLSADRTEFNMSMGVPSSYETALEKEYAYMDRLCALYPEFVKKYDPMASAATTQVVTIDNVDYTITVNPMSSVLTKMQSAGFSDYPDYAKGISEETTILYNAGGGVTYNVTYLPTPAYKTYIYRFNRFQNPAAGNNLLAVNGKKVMLIVAGTHGLEYISQLNACIFARLLCESSSPDYVRLAESADIYILPCLNGYGTYHTTRMNANLIDVNRNFPVTSWVKNGEAGVSSYSGEVAGSEFETQLVMSLVDVLSPHFAIDHHSYHTSPTQCYVDPWLEYYYDRENIRKEVYQAFCDATYTYIKNFPERFGVTPRIFSDMDGAVPASMPIPQSDTRGIMGCYFANKGCLLGATIEIGHGYCYNNGVLIPSDVGTGRDYFGIGAYEIGEYFLRTTLLRQFQYILDTY